MPIKMIKIAIIGFLIIVFYALSHISILNQKCNGTVESPCIVQDTSYNKFKVKNWRDSFMLSEAYKGNKIGLEELWISGSAVPSENGFKTIKDNILKATAHKVKKIIDVDLREESHGYLNGDAIELNSVNNWINKGKSQQTVLLEESIWLNQLEEYNIISNIIQKKQFKSSNFTDGVTYVVISVNDEKFIAEKEGFEYVRFNVTDHLKPDPETVQRFIKFVDNLPQNTWLHFHCRAGKGRTTTFMVMYDILKNADKVSFEEILARQSSVSPFVDLNSFKKDNEERRFYNEERYLFLKDFYNSIKGRKL